VQVGIAVERQRTGEGDDLGCGAGDLERDLDRPVSSGRRIDARPHRRHEVQVGDRVLLDELLR
jgi:hypothetical protein